MSAPIGIALVVEDEPLIAMLACDFLHDMGHIVFEARTCKDAMVQPLKGIHLSSPMLILLTALPAPTWRSW